MNSFHVRANNLLHERRINLEKALPPPARVVNIAVTKTEHPVRAVNPVLTGSGAKVPVEAEALSSPSCPRVSTGAGKCKSAASGMMERQRQHRSDRARNATAAA